MTQKKERSLLSHPMGKWGLFMGLLFVVWFGGWFVFASFADKWVGQAIANVDDRGVRVECSDRQIKGFPFRVGVACEDLNVAHKRDVYRMEFGRFRSAAQLYDPGKMIAEIDGPFRSWPGGSEISAVWQSARLFVDANFDGGFDLASFTVADLQARSKVVNAKAQTGAVHLRPTPEAIDQSNGSLDSALSLSALSLEGSAGGIPEFNLNADLTLLDGYKDLVLSRLPLRTVMGDGAQLSIKNVSVETAQGGRLALVGSVEIHQDGLLSGDIDIGMLEPDAFVEWANKIDPNLTGPLNLLASAIRGGKSKEIGAMQMKSVSISIKRGQPRLGFLPLPFKIPPLRIN